MQQKALNYFCPWVGISFSPKSFIAPISNPYFFLDTHRKQKTVLGRRGKSFFLAYLKKRMLVNQYWPNIFTLHNADIASNMLIISDATEMKKYSPTPSIIHFLSQYKWFGTI